MLQVKYRHKWRILSILIGILLLIGAIIGWLWMGSSQITHKNDLNKTETIVKKPQPQSISSKMLFTGNIFWGRYMNDWSMASPLGIAYPFSRLNEFNRDSYDAWIAGLECPTVAGVNMTSAEMEAALQFNCSPDYLPEAAKWFTAVTLANNHTDNQGTEGFTETQAQLDKNGIQYFGHYDPRVIEDVCEVISIPVTVISDDISVTKGKLPIALCGYHGVFRIPPPESIAVMEQYAKLMPVIAMPHMGTEYQSAPDELKTNFYRSLIDGGADMVLGDHPHWIQTTESYKGHLIVYSMGNFMFDQQDTAEVTRSAAIEVVIKTSDNSSDLLKKWLILGEKCGTYHDTCLADAQSQGLTKLNITFGFDAIGTNDANKITKPATAQQQTSILQRLNWQSTMNQLQPPYTKL
jgi:poly-gamma-glutamate synthesis protein (capsule biosynthesis protein)